MLFNNSFIFSPLDGISHCSPGHVTFGGRNCGVSTERRANLQQWSDTASSKHLSYPQGRDHSKGPRGHRTGRLRINPRGPEDQSLRNFGRTCTTRSGEQPSDPDRSNRSKLSSLLLHYRRHLSSSSCKK